MAVCGDCVMNINVIKTDISAVQHRAHICSLTTNNLQLIAEWQIYNSDISIGSNMSVFNVYMTVFVLYPERPTSPLRFPGNPTAAAGTGWPEEKQ